MSTSSAVWLWALAAAIVSTVYFFLIKEYSNRKNPLIIAIVIALELLVIFLYFQSLQKVSSGIVYSVINGFSVILGAMIALFYFKEKLTALDAVGIAAIVIGIVIVGRHKMER